MRIAITIMTMLVLAAGPLYGQTPDQAAPPSPEQEQPEVLTSGPVHEAFAEPVDLQVQAGVVAPTQPPPNIEEAPPAQSPQSSRYVWVPGYWAWDADRRNYIWVSACWRAAPPGTYWVPGYWAQVSEGWEWVAGFWAPTGSAQEIEYLPAPPPLPDIQPGPPPSPDVVWVPPCWYWNQTQYIQRPGYWLTPQPDWLWVPSHYVWTPRGYVFVAGHWDYTLEHRGVLFAPVYFPPHFYHQRGYIYSPSIVIDIGALQLSLFTYPRYCHYYFGDYYDNAYLSIGIYPWFECRHYHTWYDPIYEHDRWHYHKSEPRWEENQRHEYDRFRADRNLRPSRTYHEMESRMAKLPEQQRRNVRMAQPLTAFAADKSTHMKFEKNSSKSQRNISAQATAVHKFGAERSRWESPPVPKEDQRTVEHKTQGTQPVQHREPTTATQERKAPVEQPTQRREPTAVTQERKAPVEQPTERKEPTTATPGRKITTQPAERKEQVTQPTETKTQYVAPRQVRVTKPERVKVSNPPIVGKQSAGETTPPPRPAKERNDRGDAKDTPDRGQSKDTPKGQDRQKKN